MPDRLQLTPLRPREFFAVPWSGEGEDACQWSNTSGELIDTIRLRLFGLPIGRMVMRLRPVLPAA